MNPRTCVGCRQKADATELIRIVVDAVETDLIRVDVQRLLPGRGAHLHPTTRCYEAATRRRAFGRALRTAQSLRTDELERYLFEANNSK